MAIIGNKLKSFIWITSLILLFFSCSAVPILEVTYRLPSQSPNLEGKKIYLKIEDNRSVKDIIGERARNDFEHYTGLLILYLSEGEEKPTKLGAYDIKSMFYETFKTRLKKSGIEVVTPGSTNQIGLVIQLNQFLLDLVDRKWILTIDCKAVLMKQEQVLFSQTVHGEAERLKVIGLEQADKIMSQLITDVVNRPDLEEMFEKLNQHTG